MQLLPKQFASDNYSGICPEALDAMVKANVDHERPYGDDTWTAKAADKLREVFETDCEVFFVFNGTAANSLVLGSMCNSYNSVICCKTAHIETDECGAPGFFSHGSTLLVGEGTDGKINPAEIDRLVNIRNDIHYPRPKAVSITQSTELGTVYTKDELLAVKEAADRHSLTIHMDGARFANAVASLNISPREITAECGVDVLCFGGTKNGMAVGEAVVYFNKELAKDFEYRCKQAGQLASKMRFIASAWYGMLDSGAWLRYAAHANKCAQLLENKLKAIPGVSIVCPRQANAVFVKMEDRVIIDLHSKGWLFYTFIGSGGARLMCSWDTTEEEIDRFVNDVKVSITESK